MASTSDGASTSQAVGPRRSVQPVVGDPAHAHRPTRRWRLALAGVVLAEQPEVDVHDAVTEGGEEVLAVSAHVVEHATVDQGGIEEPALRTGHLDHPADELGALGPRQAVQRVALRHYTPAALPMRARGSAAAAKPPRASAVMAWAWPNPESNGAATSTRWPRAASPSTHDGGA